MSRGAFQAALKTLLESKEFFSNSLAVTPRPIPVVTQYEKQSASMLAAAVAKDAGLCVFIEVVDAQVKHPNDEGPVYNPALTTISVYANPDVNEEGGIGVPAVEVSDAIARIVQNNDVPGFGRCYVVRNSPAPDDEYERHDVIVGAVIPLSTAEPVRTYLTDELGNRLTDENSDTLIDT